MNRRFKIESDEFRRKNKINEYCDGIRSLDRKIKEKNFNCKVNSRHHFFKNQSSISSKFLTYEIK